MTITITIQQLIIENNNQDNVNVLSNTTAKYAQMLDDKKLTGDEVNKYGYYKFSQTTRQKKN